LWYHENDNIDLLEKFARTPKSVLEDGRENKGINDEDRWKLVLVRVEQIIDK